MPDRYICSHRHFYQPPQIVWGIRDFECRPGRVLEGMWLAETAVDTETLDLFAFFGPRACGLAPAVAQGAQSGSAAKEWAAAFAALGEKVCVRVS